MSGVALVPATVSATLLLTSTAALAAPPEGWAPTDPVSGLQFLLVLLLIPLTLFVVIGGLSMIGTRRSSGSYTPGLAWRNESEWFGGPRETSAGTEPAELEGAEADQRGGGSGRW